MVPQSILNRIQADAPKMNPDIADGLITRLLPSAEALIDGIWRAIAEKFPPGLKYLGYSRCSPEEEFYKLSRKKNNKKDDRLNVELAKSTVYPVRYHLSYDGEEIPDHCYIFLPFVDSGGSMIINGPNYFATPVLSDIVLSFEGDSIFVKLLRDKFNIRAINHDIKVNGKADTVPVVKSALYHPKEKQSSAKKESAESALAHYLFCKYGVIGAFERYAQCTPIIVNKNIDNTVWDPETYVTVESMGYVSQILDDTKTATPIKLIFEKDKFTNIARSLAAGFYFVVDKHPIKITTEVCSTRIEPQDKEAESLSHDALWIWNVVLGYNILGSSKGYGSAKLFDGGKEHIRSLDDYIDEITKRRLEKIGIVAENTYDFFAAIIEKFNDYIAIAAHVGSSIYNKELSGLLDILFPITSKIFKFHYQLRKLEKMNIGKKRLTWIDIQKILKSTITPRVIFDLNKGKLGVTNISYSGDCKPLKVTATVTPQRDINGKGSQDRKNDDPMRRLHVSFAEVGNIFMLSRATPIGNEKINPYIQISTDGRIIRNEGKRNALDYAQRLIDRTTRQQANVANLDTE